jgi:predicted transcriptional regulator
MTVVTIKIANEQDLPELEKFLANKGLEFEVEEDDEWGDLSEREIEGIKAGLADIEARRVHTHEEVRAYMAMKFEHLRKKNG